MHPELVLDSRLGHECPPPARQHQLASAAEALSLSLSLSLPPSLSLSLSLSRSSSPGLRGELSRPGARAPAFYGLLGRSESSDVCIDRNGRVLDITVVLFRSTPSFLPPGESPHAEPGQAPPFPFVWWNRALGS